ncbi:MAG TPA: hypothetical protein VMT89_06365, partial [Candidatus Acidoferrales bacterium]|nr:hypothetical protein [Candidatus Acidoferrales bacterium]
FISVGAVLARRSCYDRIGAFDSTIDTSIDWDTWLRISRYFPFVGTNAVLLRYRVVAASMTSAFDTNLQHRVRVLQKYFGRPLDAAANPRERLAYARTYLAAVVDNACAGNLEQAYECAVKMVEAYPEILRQQTSSYEIACSIQPRGFRGDFVSVDLDATARWMNDLLTRLFGDSRIATRASHVRREAYANTDFTLALLSYGARRMPETRRWLWRAVRSNPRMASDRQWLSTMLRSLLLPLFGRSRQPAATN